MYLPWSIGDTKDCLLALLISQSKLKPLENDDKLHTTIRDIESWGALCCVHMRGVLLAEDT